MATNGNVAYTYDSSAGSYQSAGDGLDACETFLESYSRGNIEVGGEEPPELARKDIPLDILLAGDFAAPHPPDDDQRVRELYVPSRPANTDTNSVSSKN
jgi:hypothetical protein